MMGTNYFPLSWSTLRLGLSFLLLPQLASSTIYLPSYNISYQSMPALFGGTWSEDVTVKAYLQLVAEEPLLCESPQDASLNNAITVPLPSTDDSDNNTESPIPIPVALLVQRGECTFAQKAAVALQWAPTVKYVIVYDNEISNFLVPMGTDEEGEENSIALLFVSYHSGMGKLVSLFENHGKIYQSNDDEQLQNCTTFWYNLYPHHTYSYAIYVSRFQN